MAGRGSKLLQQALAMKQKKEEEERQQEPPKIQETPNIQPSTSSQSQPTEPGESQQASLVSTLIKRVIFIFRI